VPVAFRHSDVRAFAASALLTALLVTVPSTASAASVTTTPAPSIATTFSATSFDLAAASKTGSGGWYWPVGTENFQGWDGYWVYRSANHSWHMAQDMPSPVGHPVYAVGDGVILESKPGAGYGGVLVVLHRNLEGGLFKAVYGHINRRTNTAKGDHVKAGQVIGTVNGCRHVHFGIHPGRKYPKDRNPFRGHTYDKHETYGWVDPVKYLRANPRSMSYTAPSLPCATVVTATAEPTFLGVASKAVYFSVPATEEATLRFHRPLKGGAASLIPTDDVLPSLDCTRYSASLKTATSISVYDHSPKLSVHYSTKSPAYHGTITVTGTLLNASGKAFGGTKVALERSEDGTSWVTVASATTGPHGKYWLRYRPSRGYPTRVSFAGSKKYLTAATATVTVAPRPGLCAPHAPARVKHGRRFEVEGELRAHHAKGAHTVLLESQRRRNGKWTGEFTDRSTNKDSHGATVYEHWLKLRAGTWRVRAKCAPDVQHAAETSHWVTVSVR